MPRKFKTEEAKQNNYDYRKKYDKEKYKHLRVKLKIHEDAELLNWMDGENADGHSYSSLIKEALQYYYEKSK